MGHPHKTRNLRENNRKRKKTEQSTCSLRFLSLSRTQVSVPEHHLSLSVFPYLLFPVVGQPLFIGSLSLSISSLRFFGSKDLSILDVKLAIFFSFFFFFFCSVLKPLPRVSYLRSAVEFIFPLKS